jgi:hypothetical protein
MQDREARDSSTLLVNKPALFGKELFKLLGNLPANPQLAGTGHTARIRQPNR